MVDASGSESLIEGVLHVTRPHRRAELPAGSASRLPVVEPVEARFDVPLLASFEEVLAPAVAEVDGDAFTPTRLRDTLLTAKPFENDPNFLFGRELPSCTATNVAHGCLGGRLLLPARSQKAGSVSSSGS
jgi:hypothetical protein